MAELIDQSVKSEVAPSPAAPPHAELAGLAAPSRSDPRIARAIGLLLGIGSTIMTSCDKQSPPPAPPTTSQGSNHKAATPSDTVSIPNPYVNSVPAAVAPSEELRNSDAWKGYSAKYGDRTDSGLLPFSSEHGMSTPLVMPGEWKPVSIANADKWDDFSTLLLNSQIHLISNVLEPKDPRIKELQTASYWAMSQSEPEFFFSYAAYQTASNDKPELVKVRIESLQAYIYSTISLMHEGFHKANHKLPAASERQKRASEVEAHDQEARDCDRLIEFLKTSPLVAEDWRRQNLAGVVEQITAWKDQALYKAHIYDIGVLLLDLGSEQANLHKFCTKEGLTSELDQLKQLQPLWRKAVDAQLGPERIPEAKEVLAELEKIISASERLSKHPAQAKFAERAVIWHGAIKNAEEHQKYMEDHYSAQKK